MSFFALNLHAKTTTVQNFNDAGAGSLRQAILDSVAGDTINFAAAPTGVSPLTLASPLPAINFSLTIAGNSGSPFPIDGGTNFQAFSVSTGTVSFSNLVIQNTNCKGGAGGNGVAGGGGGVGGGGAIYVHDGASVSISSVQFSGNQATGGGGGVSAAVGGGGGGGGFGGGAGGAGSGALGGGGGGGNTGGGAGGSNAVGTAGTNSGGGGGGSGANAGGASGSFTGGAASGNNGGGGAGAGGNGGTATASAGGPGGTGIGTDATFGGGGGGGGSAALIGGAGLGAGGGGGGGSTGSGGAGGTNGGGGGGGDIASSGGAGGFGAGGGGSALGGSGGSSLFGGGAGGTTGGGGGAGLGGAIFIQNGGTLTVGDSNTFSSPSADTVVRGAGGGGGAGNGTVLGPDIFLRSGGSLVFTTTGNLTFNTSINSDQGTGGGTGGGLTMSGSGTLTLLPTGNPVTVPVIAATNTYSGGTTVSAGTLVAASDTYLGVLTDTLTIGTATFQPGAVSYARPITLSGTATINTTAGTTTLSGVISSGGSLTKIGTGTLILSGTNTYSGGTIVNAGTLSIGADANLGNSSGSLTLGAATLLFTGNIPSSSRAVKLTAASNTATIDTGAFSVRLDGQISGSGGFTKVSGGTLTLTGANNYTGGTVISAGTVIGTTASLQGSIQDNSILTFNQSFAGTYAGQLSGNGTLNFIGGGAYTFTGASSFSGTTNVTSGQLNMLGSLNSSSVNVAAGSTISGTGSIGPLDNSGIAAPGSGSSGTLTVQGNATFEAGSSLSIATVPKSSNSLAVTGTAALGANNGTVSVNIGSGFYGLHESFAILTAGSVTGTFSPTVTISGMGGATALLSYTGTEVDLTLTFLRPFLEFPFANGNEKNVGENIDNLNAAGLLSADLANIIDNLAGETTAQINEALDEMHPAQYSAFAELQSDVGSQLISIFQRRPFMMCYCFNPNHLWVEPFGDWLNVDNKGEQIGFDVQTRGVAFGYDRELLDGWVMGIGGAWDLADFFWQQKRGHADIESFYGAFYTDYQADDFYLGAAVLAGLDFYDTSRLIQFVARRATANFHALDIIGQLSGAYFFGAPACHLYPYVNLDYFRLQTQKFTESGAGGLNLDVLGNTSTTFRGETGVGLQVQDTNYDQTICISPNMALGYAIECPVQREVIRTNFVGAPIPFHVVGWKEYWQFFTVDFGMSLSFYCVSLSGGYHLDLSPGGRESALFSQRGNVRLELNW